MSDRDYCRECGLDLADDPWGDHDEGHQDDGLCWSCLEGGDPTPQEQAECWVREEGITNVADLMLILRGQLPDDELRELAERALAPVRFVSPDELRASTPDDPPWVWGGYLARGGVTVLAGKPKVGKSTLALAAGHAVESDADGFLGHAVTGGPVVYVSEEGAATLAHKVAGERLRIATRETAWPRPEWVALIEATRVEAERVGAALIVIDTFAFWAMLKADAEKDAGAVQEAMAPLVQLADAGFAVLLVAHARKGNNVEGGEGDAVRGSSAIIGAADIVLELERVKDLPRQRKLLALSRYPQTPGVLIFERDGETWTVVGEGTDRSDARTIAARGVLLDALSLDEDRTRAELEAAGVDWRDSHDALDGLIATGVVARSGEGKKGDPYRYRKLWESAPQKPTESVGADGLGVGVCIPVGDTPTQTAPPRFRSGTASAQKPPESDQERAEGLAERHADIPERERVDTDGRAAARKEQDG
jgi:hypothetical protein